MLLFRRLGSASLHPSYIDRERYKRKEEQYLAQRKNRIAAVKAEEDAKPVPTLSELHARWHGYFGPGTPRLSVTIDASGSASSQNLTDGSIIF